MPEIAEVLPNVGPHSDPRGCDMPTCPVCADTMIAAEASAYLRLKVRTLLLWVRQGKVKAYALSGTKRHVWRFRQTDLDAVLLAETAVVNCDPLSVYDGVAAK